ncbi:unnamed protein product, partial [Acanthoscelides obtectus]
EKVTVRESFIATHEFNSDREPIKSAARSLNLLKMVSSKQILIGSFTLFVFWKALRKFSQEDINLCNCLGFPSKGGMLSA